MSVLIICDWTVLTPDVEMEIFFGIYLMVHEHPRYVYGKQLPHL